MFVQTYNQVIGKNITNKKNEEIFENYKKKFLNKFYIFSHDHQGHYMLSYKIFKDYPLAGTGIKVLDIYVGTKYIYWIIMMAAQPILIIFMCKY